MKSMERTFNESPIGRKASGFSLLECVFAILILTIGMLAVVGLAATATQTELSSYRSTQATTLAVSKIEELKSAQTLTNGGSLTANISGYHDAPDLEYYRRWQISDGPAGTKRVTVVVVPQLGSSRIRKAEISTLIR